MSLGVQPRSRWLYYNTLPEDRRNLPRAVQDHAQSELRPAYKHQLFLQNAASETSHWLGALAPGAHVAAVEEAACRSSVSPWRT